MADLKLKNQVKLVGTIANLDVDFKEFETKSGPKAGEKYGAVVGTIDLNTGEDNIVSLRIFQKEKFNNGNDNPNYKQYKAWNDRQNENQDLSEIVVGMSTSIDSNVFVAQDGNLVTATNIQAGFLDRKTPGGNPRAEFATEVIVNAGAIVPEIKDDIETGRAILNVELADFTGRVYPARFILENEDGIKYLEEVSASGSTILEIWGKVINTAEITEEVVEAAFGAPRKVQTVRTRKENVVVGAAMTPREVTEEIAEAVKSGREAFEVYKTTVKEKSSAPSSTGQSASTTAPKTSAGEKTGFSF